MLAQVRRFIEAHAEGRLSWWHRADDDHAPKTLNRAGFRRLVDAEGKPIHVAAKVWRDADALAEHHAKRDDAQTEFIILPEVFKQEVCAGFRWEAVATMLRDRGLLRHEANRLTQKHRLPGLGERVNCFHLRAAILGGDD
jgi:putative DNA primase/helicase